MLQPAYCMVYRFYGRLHSQKIFIEYVCVVQWVRISAHSLVILEKI